MYTVIVQGFDDSVWVVATIFGFVEDPVCVGGDPLLVRCVKGVGAHVVLKGGREVDWVFTKPPEYVALSLYINSLLENRKVHFIYFIQLI